MAHKSLSLKLEARREQNQRASVMKKGPRGSIWGGGDAAESVKLSKQLAATHPSFESAQMKMVDVKGEPILDDNHECEFAYKRPRNMSRVDEEHHTLLNDDELTTIVDEAVDNRVDKVYTIGCFDLFHFGHVQLIKRMRELGKKVIVGVHDSRRLELYSTPSISIS